MKKKMRWRDVLFPPSPMKIIERDRKAIAEGIELTDPEEFAEIKRRLDLLERRFNDLDERLALFTGKKGEEDASELT